MSTLEFLNDFSERPAFGALIERWIDEKDQIEIYVFKKHLDALKNGASPTAFHHLEKGK